MRDFTFHGQMSMSEGISGKKDIPEILRACFPTAVSVERAKTSDDRKGIDFWVTLQCGVKDSVDVKVRDRDWTRKHPPEDDLALETWSKIGSKIGWTRDVNKRTDYIFWIWKDTRRWVLMPFPMLCSVFVENWQRWCKTYKPKNQSTRNPDGSRWDSQCVFVPRKVVWDAIDARFGGTSIYKPASDDLPDWDVVRSSEEDDEPLSCESGIAEAESILRQRSLVELLAEVEDHPF